MDSSLDLDINTTTEVTTAVTNTTQDVKMPDTIKISARGVLIEVSKDVYMQSAFLKAYALRWNNSNPLFLDYKDDEVHEWLNTYNAVSIYKYVGEQNPKRQKKLFWDVVKINDNNKFILTDINPILVDIKKKIKDDNSYAITYWLIENYAMIRINVTATSPKEEKLYSVEKIRVTSAADKFDTTIGDITYNLAYNELDDYESLIKLSTRILNRFEVLCIVYPFK